MKRAREAHVRVCAYARGRMWDDLGMTTLLEPFPTLLPARKVLIAGQSCGCPVQIALLAMPRVMDELLVGGMEVMNAPIRCSQCGSGAKASIRSAERSKGA